MALLMTVFFENGFSENYFPNVDNRNFPVAIRPYVSGLKDELILNVQVWDGHWRLRDSSQYSLILKGNPVESADLEDGTVIEGMVRKTELYFSVKIDQVQKENVSFEKYMLKEGSIFKLEIGSDDLCNIVYKNRFVTGTHAEITFESGAAYITDKNSVNGTFLNGRLVTEKTRLHYGDIIYVVGLKIVYLNNLLAINDPDGQCKIRELKAVEIPHFEDKPAEDADTEDVYFLRTPRKLLNLDKETISIEKCPKKQQQKRQPLIFTIGPSFTMVIPIALAAAMTSDGFGAGSICMSLGAAGIGAIWAVVNSAYNKKEEKESESNRVSKYLEYMVRVEEKLKNKTEYNRLVLAEQYPSSKELLEFTTSNTRRLWEKSSTHEDFLSLRLGTGDMPSPNGIEGAKEDLGSEHDPLNDHMEEIQEKFKTLHQVPAAVSLYEHRLLGVVSGDEEKRNQLMRLLALQITALHPYTDVRMCYVFPGRDLEKMEYTRWLPHTYTPDGKLRMIVCDPRAMGDVMYYLSDVIRERLEAGENQKNREEEEKVLPHYVVFISDISMIEGEPVSKYLLDPPKNAGLSVIFSADAIDKLPSHCNTIVQWEKDYCGCYSTLSKFEEMAGIAFDSVNLSEMDVFSRQLSNFKVRENASNAAIPDMLTFLDMYKTSRVEDLDMYHKWLENRTYESMRSLIGQKAGEQPVYLDIHEKYHGPHGLVAGTTGSGKSETLQTYILSLVLNYHPHEVAFILIDYKGGGMAQSFIGLPHLAGVITNLGGNQTTRALLSINAEIKRRQRIFNEYKIKHIDAYIELYRNGEAEEPMPHLLIIADEFAELKKEQPDFVRALVSAARVGRSLGINLILATQKPSGVVDDEIWSNTRFRICLRVADKQDSNEMLKRTDAAYITGTGRGFLQVGNDEIFDEFQSGWSGAPYIPEVPFNDDSKAKAVIIGLTGKPEAVKKKKKKKGDNVKKFTQLDAMVQYAANLAEENHIKPLRQIWLPPLPGLFYLDDLELTWDEKQIKLPVGLADDPQNQRQFPVYLDFIRDGHLLICGSAGSGKTSLVQTILYGAALHYTAKQVNFYIADFSSRTMTAFADLPHIGCICMEGDDEKIQMMMSFAEEELDRRKKSFSQKGMGSYRDYRESYSDVPAIFLVIDNYPAFSDSYEQYESTLIQLSREGASYGIYLIITCNNSGDIRSRILQNMTKGIGLQLADRFEYDSVIGMRSEILPDDRTTGRGLIKERVPLEFQAALPVKAFQGESMMLAIREKLKPLTENGISGARKLGTDLTMTDSGEFLEKINFRDLPDNTFVMGEQEGMFQTCDMDQTLCFTVCGSGKTGKTNFLKYTALQMKKKGAEVYVFDGCLKELEEFSRKNELDGYMTGKEELYHFMENVLLLQLGERNELVYEARQTGALVQTALKDYRRIVLLINSASEFMEAVYSEDFDVSEVLETVFEKGMEHKLHFFMALSPREYEELAGYRALRQFGSWKQGIHLGGAFDEQGIFDYEVTPSERSRTYPAGAAFTEQEGKAVLFMTPFVKEGKYE